MKTLTLILALSILSYSAIADDQSSVAKKEVTLKSADDGDIHYLEKQCLVPATTEDGSVVKVKEDCYGIHLINVVGTNAAGEEIQLGDIFLFDKDNAMLSEQATGARLALIMMKLLGQLPAGLSVELSTLRYLDKDLPLTLIGGDDETKTFKRGGITLSLEAKGKDETGTEIVKKAEVVAGLR